MKEQTNDVLLSVNESNATGDEIVTKRGNNEGGFGDRDDVMVDVVSADDLVETKVVSIEKNGVEAVKEVIEENVVSVVATGLDCDDQKKENGSVVGKTDSGPGSEEAESGGGNEVSESVKEKYRKESEGLSLLKVTESAENGFQSTIEAETNGGQEFGNGDLKMGGETLNDEREKGMREVGSVMNERTGKDEALDATKMPESQTVVDEEPQVIEGEIGVKDKKEDLESGMPKETVDQSTGFVQETGDEDLVMDEKTVKDEVSQSLTMGSLGLLEDIDVEVVDEDLEGQNDAHDSVSAELNLGCCDNQSLSTEVVNLGTVEVDPKVKVESTSKNENSYTDEAKTAHKETNSHVGIINGDSNNFQEDQGLTANCFNEGNEITESYNACGVLSANSEFSNEEDEGMDIDEVLGWKDEIPFVQEDEQKVEPTDLSNVSLQQMCYFSPPEHEGEFSVSDMVWGKLKSHPWWPGQIFDRSDASEKAMKYHKKDCFLVAYFGDRTFAWNDSTVLKPFREYFSQIEQHVDFEDFNKAVHCALVEVSRRVELGLACSCIPHDIYENIKCQIVENSGIKQESSRRQGLDKSASVNSFEPDKLVDFVRLLATFPYGGTDKMELTMAKAQLSSYGRFKGYRQLAEFQLCGDLLEAEQFNKDETYIEDGSRKRKLTETVEAKPSFKVGTVIQKVASQPTGLTLKGEPTDHYTASFQTPGPTHMSMSWLNSLDEAKKRKISNGNGHEEFEFDDVNDSYWTDRIIQNQPEEQALVDNRTGGEVHQVAAYEKEKPSVKLTRRSNKKRFFSSNHEVDAKEQSEVIARRKQNLATEVLMKFADGVYFPSEIHLNKMFRRFGPLLESETEVDRQSGRARVVFKKCSDAEVACSSARTINIFGSVSVNYELNYTPLISYKPLPIPLAQDSAHAC